MSLVEVVVATAVLSILMLGLFSALGSATTNEALMQEMEVANRYASQQIDEVLMSVTDDTSFEALAAHASSFHVPYTGRSGVTMNLKAAKVTPNPGGMAGRLLIVPASAGNYTYNGHTYHLLQATARVRWNSADGTDQEIVVVSLKARP